MIRAFLIYSYDHDFRFFHGVADGGFEKSQLYYITSQQKNKGDNEKNEETPGRLSCRIPATPRQKKKPHPEENPDAAILSSLSRPFLVLIRDNWTGLILFMGRINDPGK